jgi:hypothetical protein
MSDETAQQSLHPQSVSQPHPSILNQTLGQLLENNTHAQGMITQAMKISPQQLQEMLKTTGNNQLMNMTIGDLFKNGIVQQATGQAQQVSPEQFQQIIQATGSSQPAQGMPAINAAPVGETTAPKQSFLQKLKGLFR